MNLQTLKVVITADASGFNKTIKNVKSQLSGLNNTVENATSGITQSLQSISKKVSFAAITAGLATLSRSAIRAASDLQEVQNVVDNAFGKADEDIEKFAKNAIYQFGISEYAAKKYSSTLMAMGRSMGVATDKSKTMSIQLTGLASDLASFYNTDVETAFNALQSIYTGTVRPLRQYGVALSEAALQEYANAKGINKKVSAMNAAEKATLRYNFVLEKTALAQGDFARTNMSWHNSLQTISNQLNNLAVVVGTLLMNVFQPLVNMLSTIVSYAVKAAQALAAMFGINLQFSSNTNGIADAWDDATEATEDATGAAKKYKKLIDGFDELNIMTSTNGGSGASGIGSGGFDVGSYFDITEGQEKLIDFNKWLADIDEWLVKAEQTFEDLGIKLGIKFNSLVHYLDWALIGKTIIDGLNNIFITINRYFDKANFINFGYVIATMVNSALETIKPEEWGQILVNKLNAMWQFAYGFLSLLDWALLGDTIVSVVRTALEKIDADSISGAIVGLLNGFTTMIMDWPDTFPITEMIDKIWSIFDKVIHGVNWKQLGESINKLVIELFNGLKNIDFSQITKAIADFLSGLDIVGLFKEYVITRLETAFELIKGLNSTGNGSAMFLVGLGSMLLGFAHQFMAFGWQISKTIITLKSFFGDKGIMKSITGGIAEIFEILSGNGATDWTEEGEGNIILTFKEGLEGLNNTLKDLGIKEYFKDIMRSIGSSIKGYALSAFELFKSGLSALIHPITTIKGIWGSLIGGIKSLWALLANNPVALLVAAIVALVASFIDAYKNSEVLRTSISNIWGYIKDFASFLFGIIKDLWNTYLSPLWERIKALVISLQTVLKPLWEIIANGLELIVHLLSVVLKPIISGAYHFLEIVLLQPLKNGLELTMVVLEALINWIGNVIQGISDLVDKAAEGIKFGINLIEGIFQGIVSALAGIKEWLKANIYDPIVNGFKSLFGINSPSTVFAELGGYLVAGLFQGISLSEFWGSIQTWFNDKLTGMKQWCSDTWTSISTTASEKWNNIKETVGTSVSKIGETISTWGQGASDNFNTIMSNIGSVIGDALGIDTTNWGDGLNEMLGLSGDFGKGIVDYFGDIGKSIANNLTNGANGGITALNGLVSAYKRAKAEDYASQLGAYNAQIASLKAAGAKVFPSFSPKPFPKISLPSLFSFIPRLASGGVITSETMAVMGEYPGARSNPEIVSPQNILRETIDASNGEMVNAFAQMTRQIITAIDGVDMNVSIGDDVIANSASRGDKAYRKRTGKSLFAY